MGSAWTLRRFAVLPLGSSSTSAAAGVAGAARGVGVGELLVCEVGRLLLVATRLGAASGHHAEAHGGRGCAPEERVPELLASWADRASASCTCLVANSDQSDRAMAARSARTSSREEESRSTDDEERLLTKRSIEGQWKKHFAGTNLFGQWKG